MSVWECGVCGYIHKEENPPEKCPVCEAPDKMFEEMKNEEVESADQQHEKSDIKEQQEEEFVEVIKSEKSGISKDTVAAKSGRRWRCTVCGYIHEENEPPEKCPMCGAASSYFVEIDADGKTIGGEESDVDNGVGVPDAPGSEVQAPATFFGRIVSLILKFHLHPIHTHFPNGILPAMVVFLGLGIFLNISSLEVAAFYNSIAVLVMLPIVIFTGYIEWQNRYNGLKSALFITKITCSLIVLASVNVLVFWRVIDPAVAAEGSPTQMIYFGLAGLALAAAGIAGHLGGKLVFAGRK